MKQLNHIYFPVLFLLSLSCLSSWAQAPKASDDDPEFVEARKLFWASQFNEAEVKLKKYLAEHPNHSPSRDFLKMIAQSRKYDPQQIELTKKFLETQKIDFFDLKEVDWREAIARLEAIGNVRKQKDPQYVNFINMLPSSYHKPISVNLRNVTLMEAITTLSKQAELRFVIDTWAVIFDIPPARK